MSKLTIIQLMNACLEKGLKKEQVEVLVGDYVEIEELNDETLQAVINNVDERSSHITRPNIANMEQNIIIMAINKPLLASPSLTDL